MVRLHSPLVLALLAAFVLMAPHATYAGGEGPGHVHGPDGRHGPASRLPPPISRFPHPSILSHHDLKITDTSKFSVRTEGAVVEGADVHSVIHKKGDPKAVVHREHNAYEPENGVYGSHMMYREPGEYVIIENITLPGGRKYTLQFPIWVPGPPGGAGRTGPSPLMLLLGGLAVLLFIAAAFMLGRRSGRRAAAHLSVLALITGLAPLSDAQAGDEEPGHMHGPDGRHIAIAETFGEGGPALRAFLGPNREIEAFQTRDNYRFRLFIENEELAPPDPDVVTLSPDAIQAIGLQTVAVTARPFGGGLSTTGQVRPNPNGVVTVNSRVSGRVVRLNVTPGQRIGAGHVVAVVDSTEVAEAQAALARARSEQGQAEAARSRGRAGVSRAEAQVAEAESARDRAEAERAEAQAEVDHARAEAELARGKVEAARKALARQQQFAATGAFSQGPVEEARSAVAAREGELREAQAALENQEAQARRMEQGLKAGVTARKDVEAAQAVAAQARTRVHTLQRQLEIGRAALAREERIQRENLRNNREVQQAEADLEAAQLAVRAAEAAVTRQGRAVETAAAVVASQGRTVQAAQAQVDAARSELAQADAALAGARRAVQSAHSRLRLLGAAAGGGNQIEVAAPIGGVVDTRPANVGEVVQSGQTLCTLLNAGTVWVESDVFEKDLPRVRLGQRVTLATDAVPGRTFQGTINYIGSEVNPETRAVRVRTVVPNPGEVLKPNMFVRVMIASGSGSVLTVPQAAVQEADGEHVVFIEEAPGAYRRRIVHTGTTLGDQVVIEDGLKPGDRIVTRGAYQLLAKANRR
jgi:membrane fusion protein, heavy metal efflux system